jgi:hypothetical protein
MTRNRQVIKLARSAGSDRTRCHVIGVNISVLIILVQNNIYIYDDCHYVVYRANRSLKWYQSKEKPSELESKRSKHTQENSHALPTRKHTQHAATLNYFSPPVYLL